MNEFRQALAALADGRLDLEAVQRALTSTLAREPEHAAACCAEVEALYRADRIAGEVYLALVQAIRGDGGAERTRFRARESSNSPRAGNAGPAETGRARSSASPAAVPERDETLYRGAGTRLEEGSGAAPDPTRLRVRAPPGAAQPTPDAPAADATRLRARARPQSRESQAPAREAVPAGGDSSWSPASGSHGGSGTGTGSSSWSDPSRWSSAETVPLTVGSVVKERFVLEQEIGRGGMGIVFKSRDLRMEEAQDRNPYVALKILNDEFKRHPESLKALQREFRKAQSLAHPNVVTVGDFDRDGGNVFMTMELLEGEPLDRLIKRAGSTGLEKHEALRITRDICRAMAYAHERGIVHSDFKPANAFLTRDGVVKVFDFGIARAVKQSDKAAGTVTLFDAGTLGGLTPAYASCEMIEGLDPDVRDDVYAIACVTYELLTGRHPFGRKSAVRAREAGLVPARPAGLSRGQWRALKRGLAFRREKRCASAIELLNGLLPPKRSPAVYVGVGLAIVAIAVVAIVVVPGQVRQYEQRRWLAALRSGAAARIETVLPALDRLSATRRDAIFADRAARDGLIRFYEAKIDGAESRGNYFAAGQFAKKLLAYLPDYADAQRIAQRVRSDSSNAIERQSNAFDADLAAGRLVPAQGTDNVEAVLAAVRRIDPHSELLHDPRLPGAFAAQARVALKDSNTALAKELVTNGLKSAPANPVLRNLRDRVNATLLARHTSALVARLEKSLTALLKSRPALADLLSRREDLTRLRTDAPGSAVLAHVQHYAEKHIGAKMRGLEHRHDYSQAQSLLDAYSALASAGFVERQREILSDARLAGQHKVADEARMRRERIKALKARLAALLSQGPGSAPARWDAQLNAQQGALGAYLAPSDPYFTQVRSRAAADYLSEADRLRRADRLSRAEQMLKHARAYGASAAKVGREAKLLGAARAQLAASAAAQEQQAQTEALQQKLLVQAAANNVNGALASLAALNTRLPASDPFLTNKAPAAIGRGYLRLAESAALDGRFGEAQRLVDKGRTTVPSFAPLAGAAQRYARYVSLDREMASVDAHDVGRVRAQIEQASKLAPREARALEHALAHSFARRIGSAPNAAAADRLRALGHRLFPHERQFVKGASTAPVPASSTALAQPSPGASSATPTPSSAAVPAAPAPLAARAGAAKSTSATAQPLSLHNCANPELIGAGSNPRASCWDKIAGGRGPMLVVVPAPPGGHPFAIGRYDVSNAEFARYCHATGKCPVRSASPSLPVTSISITQAEGYLHWLSHASGAAYRLPSAAEYVYAADAGTPGGQNQDANCRKPGVAATLLPVNSGAPNAWGLYDSDGNVQQWVRSGKQLQVRGGDYRDSFSQCKPSTSRAQSGTPSPVTGFRVLRVIK